MRGFSRNVCCRLFFNGCSQCSQHGFVALHVDYNRPGSAFMGKPRSVQSDRSIHQQGYRTGVIQSSIDNPGGVWRDRLFADHRHLNNLFSPKFCSEESTEILPYAYVRNSLRGEACETI